MFWMGRYALIQLREFKPPLEMSVSHPPYYEFENTSGGTRAAAVYAGGKNKHLAVWFLKFLASEDYNMQVVRDADAEPPNPIYTKTPDYVQPPDHPNEVGVHEPWANMLATISIGGSYSEFVVPKVGERIQTEEYDAYMSGIRSAAEAAANMQKRIQAEIDRNLAEKGPALRKLYEERVALQQRIDQLKASGQLLPADWVTDTFLRRYYEFKGLLSTQPAAAAPALAQPALAQPAPAQPVGR
jgi:multiple sugar transport system substrate-binding protein